MDPPAGSSEPLTTIMASVRSIPEYNYEDLPADGTHIRLLKLEPGEREDFIHCHLVPTTLEEARGTYECISYVCEFAPSS